MTTQNPYGRYAVYSAHNYHTRFPNAVPVGRYDRLAEAIAHAESVTYRMAIIDMTAESRGFVYCNWENAPASSPWGAVQQAKLLDIGIWSVSTAGHGGIWLADGRLTELCEIMGYEYPTFAGYRSWFEEDCDWCIPAIAFQIERYYEPACKQLRGMAQQWDSEKYIRAYNSLVDAGRILDAEKVKQEIKRHPSTSHCVVGNSYDISHSDADPGL